MPQLIQSGESNKPSLGSILIEFDEPFATPPTVVVSSYWRGEGSQVGSIATISEITVEDFTVVNQSAGDNYFITWVAVGDSQ